MNIKEKRKEKRLSQSQLANMVGVNQTAVSQWERGATMPSLDKAALIANALGCTIDDRERPVYNQIMSDLREIVEAVIAISFTTEGQEKTPYRSANR